MDKEQREFMMNLGREKRSQAFHEFGKGGDPALGNKLLAESAVERFEGLKKLWKEWYPDKMSYHDEATFMMQFYGALEDMENDAKRSPDPTSPEYDEMISCFLPRKQRQELKDRGLNRQQIAEIAKEQILIAEWANKQDTEEKRQLLGSGFFIGHYTGFSNETTELLRNEEKAYQNREIPGELKDYIAQKRDFLTLADCIGTVGNRRRYRLYMVEYAEKASGVAGKESAKKTERAAEPKAETKKEPASVKSVFSTVKGFVKYITMSADEKARIADEKARIADEKARIAAEEKRAAAEKAKINKLKASLENGGKYGIQSLKMLNDSEYRIGFDSLGSVASSIDPEAKTITLNSAMSDATQVLSLVNAACVLKQEKDGAGKSPEIMAVRKAEAFAIQTVVARNLDPYEKKYKELYENKLCGMYDNCYKEEESRHLHEEDEYIDKPKSAIFEHARSSFVDAYLDKVLPADKRPSPEQIAKVCRDFEGKSYYTPDNWYSKTGKKEMSAGQSGQTEFKKPDSVYKETINPAIIAKMQQQGR